MTVRFGIVGYGNIAVAHADAIHSCGDAELVAVADPDDRARQAASERWGCGVYESVGQMLGAVKIDAACVCAPPALHRSLTEQLLDAGVHVLCEKPLSVTLQDARVMMELAEERQRVLAVSSKFRYVGDLLEARRQIDKGAIGRPIFYDVTLCARIPLANRWNGNRNLSGGGVVMDNGTHAYDILTVVLGEAPIVASALFGPRTVNPEVEDTAEILFQTSGKVIGRIALSWTYFTKDLDYLVVQGTTGTLRVGWSGSAVRAHGATDWTPFGSGYQKTEAFGSQMAALLSRISRPRPAWPPEEVLGALDFVERVYEVERFGRGEIPGESWATFPGLVPR